MSTRHGWTGCGRGGAAVHRLFRLDGQRPAAWCSPTIIACATAPRRFPRAGRDYVEERLPGGEARGRKALPRHAGGNAWPTISDVTQRVTKAAAGKTGQDFVKARDGEIAAVEKEGCAGKEDEIPLPGDRRCIRAASTSFTPIANIPMCGWCSRRKARPLSSAAIRTISISRAMTWIAPLCGFTRTASPPPTPDHLTWSTAPPKDGEPVFVAGNPGTTQRLLTAEQLETLRDLNLPETLMLFSELRGRLLRFTEESAEHARIADDLLFGIENSFKAYRGEEKALVDPALIAAKRTSTMPT